MKNMSNEALDALGTAIVAGPSLVLTAQLDRKVYVEVNAALTTMGGKWNRKAGAHLFSEDPTDLIENVILLGGFVDKKKDLQQFDTPKEIAHSVTIQAGIQRGHTVLEPSAGLGAIALRAADLGATVQCIELDRERFNHLGALDDERLGVRCADFLTVTPHPIYDRIVMNPPFTKGQDVKHVMHAFSFLKPGGRLVAIMSPAFQYRTTSPFWEFRDFLFNFGDGTEDLPEGAFKSSGTNVRTVMVTIVKPSL